MISPLPPLADHGHCQTDCCDLFPKLHFHGEPNRYQEIVSAWAKNKQPSNDNEATLSEAFPALAPQGDCTSSCCDLQGEFHAHGDSEQYARFAAIAGGPETR